MMHDEQRCRRAMTVQTLSSNCRERLDVIRGGQIDPQRCDVGKIEICFGQDSGNVLEGNPRLFRQARPGRPIGSDPDLTGDESNSAVAGQEDALTMKGRVEVPARFQWDESALLRPMVVSSVAAHEWCTLPQLRPAVSVC